jgi:P27 family predicted phage terminase small subunit
VIRAERLEGELIEEGEVFLTENGYPVQNPKVKMLDEVLKRINAAFRTFGMNPQARRQIVGSGRTRSEQQAENARAGWGKFGKKNARGDV